MNQNTRLWAKLRMMFYESTVSINFHYRAATVPDLGERRRLRAVYIGYGKVGATVGWYLCRAGAFPFPLRFVQRCVA